MMPVESPGLILVCLDDDRGIASLVRYGMALAHLWEAPLCLAFLLVLPKQRPLNMLSQEEERRANDVLDAAVEYVAASGVASTEGIWIARSRTDAIQQTVEDLNASAVVIGWHGSGPFGLFDAGRTLLKTMPCPVIMVGGGTDRRPVASWPPTGS